MYLTGFADEASQDLERQIEATKFLGWNAIESRCVGGVNIHDLPEDEFNRVADRLDEAGVSVNCFGSAIANWAKSIHDDFDITLKEIDRAIPRMQRLGTKLIRIMSYARCDGDEQFAEERFTRLREIVKRFQAEGIMAVHENCMNYGGMSWKHSLDLIENVEGLKLIYDTGNAPMMRDHSKTDLPWQDGWEFYSKIAEHVVYIHIKDSLNPLDGKERYTMPGEGKGYVKRILQDLQARGYDGGISIEPHLAAVFHDPDAAKRDPEKSYDLYVSYGQQLMALLNEFNYSRKPYSV
jgi:sugar phosphate isomerase/epimerase